MRASFGVFRSGALCVSSACQRGGRSGASVGGSIDL